jgi:hypothetical protein
MVPVGGAGCLRAEDLGTAAEVLRDEAVPDAVELEPKHTLLLLVPGTRWHDDGRWVTKVAWVVDDDRPSVRCW